MIEVLKSRWFYMVSVAVYGYYFYDKDLVYWFIIAPMFVFSFFEIHKWLHSKDVFVKLGLSKKDEAKEK